MSSYKIEILNKQLLAAVIAGRSLEFVTAILNRGAWPLAFAGTILWECIKKDNINLMMIFVDHIMLNSYFNDLAKTCPELRADMHDMHYSAYSKKHFNMANAMLPLVTVCSNYKAVPVRGSL